MMAVPIGKQALCVYALTFYQHMQEAASIVQQALYV